jgi:hypothetical protein
MVTDTRYRPSVDLLAKRKQLFAAINKHVMDKGTGWITSVPGAPIVTIEVLPGSTLPAELRELGYKLKPEPEGERILPAAIVQEFTLTSSGAYELATPGSTKPVAQTLRHAGIVRVMRYSFTLA